MFEWGFALLLTAAVYGGDFRVEFHTQTEDGCRRLQKVVLQQIANQMPYLQFDVRECEKRG